MTLLNPAALFLLLAIPVIVVLHLFRQERRRREVSSLYLWREISDQQSRRVRPRLLRNINLLLQLIATALAALALAQPSLRLSTVTGASELIIILDDSASMQAASTGATRMARARDAASELVAGSPRSSRVLLLSGGPRPAILQTFTQERATLNEAISRVEATDGPNDLRRALELARSLGSGEGTQIVVVTDGSIDAAEVANIRQEYSVVVVGEPMANRAITAFELRARRDASALEVLAAVANYGSEPSQVTVRITADSERIATRTLELAPFEERLFTAVVNRRTGAIYEARLDGNEDALPADDAAFAATAGERPVRIQLVTPGNLFLESLLSIYPNVQLVVRDTLSQTDPWDILILDRVPAPAGLRGNVIAFDTALPDGPFTAVGREEVSRAVSTRADHPLVEGVRLDLVSVSEAVTGTFSERANPVAWAGETPLLYTFRGDRLSLIGTTFSLANSDIALRGSFPVLVHNMIEWLAPVAPAGQAGYTAVAEPVSLFVPPGESVVVITPDGDPDRFTPAVSPFEYTETSQAGIYEVRGESFVSRFAVTLADGRESDLTPRLTSTALPGSDKEASESAGRPIWQWLALLTLLVLVADWIVWARRH